MFGMKSLQKLILTSNDLSRSFTVAGESASISVLWLERNKLSSFVGGSMLPSLKYLHLSRNEFVGDFTITPKDFPTSIKNLYLCCNQLKGFVDGGMLTNLEFLLLSVNKFAGKFAITSKNFPKSLIHLSLHDNMLTGFIDGGKFLPNLKILDLQINDFADEFIVTTDNLPASIKNLNLHRNKLTSFVDGGKFLPNLTHLNLASNKFIGELLMTEDDYPSSLTYLSFRSNYGLTKIDASESAVLSLSSLQLHNIQGIEVGYELCNRSGIDGSLNIVPDSCNNRLTAIITSLLEEQDFSSYSNADFEVAKEWFLNTDNHPTDLPMEDDEYMKVRLIAYDVSLLCLTSLRLLIILTQH